MNAKPGSLVFRDVKRRFDRAAATFAGADFVHRKTAAGLMQRLEPMLIEAKTIVDLGGANGAAARDLEKRFRRGLVMVVDASHGMLREGRKKRGWFSRRRLLQADALRLPFNTGSVDVVFANLLLPWIDDLAAAFGEVARALRPGGLFLFATLGPDSLSSLRAAWASVDHDPHVNHFTDMHDLGDGLISAGLRDPVLDQDSLVVSYRDAESLFRDLTLAGARNCLEGRRKTVTGKHRFRRMQQALEGQFRDGVLELGLEIVYGHAWGAGPRRAGGEYVIDASAIERRRAEAASLGPDRRLG